jgi:hypothetical protein
MSISGDLTTSLGDIGVTAKGGRPQDPYWGWVTLAIPGTDFKDYVTGNTVTKIGNPALETTIKPFRKSGSIHLTSGNEFKIPAAWLSSFGRGQFTLEFWIYAPTQPINKTIFTNASPTGASSYPRISVTTSGTGVPQFYVNDLAPKYGWSSNAGTNKLATPVGWHHIAIVRATGNTAMFFYDGKGYSWSQYLTASDLSNMVNDLVFGRDTYIGSGYDIDAYISDIRFTDGIARYNPNGTYYSSGTQVFTPPQYAMPLTGPALHKGTLSQTLGSIGISAEGAHVAYSLKNITILASGKVPPKQDPLYGFVVFLSHGESFENLANGDVATLVSYSGGQESLTPSPNDAVVDPIGKKFGWGALKVQNEYYESPYYQNIGMLRWPSNGAYSLGTGELTIELSFMLSQKVFESKSGTGWSAAAGATLLNIGRPNNYSSIILAVDSNGRLRLDVYDETGYSKTTYGSGNVLKPWEWHDVAIVRGFDPNQNPPYGTNDFYLYCDGVLIGSTWRCEANLQLLETDGFIQITSAVQSPVWIDEIRITKGVARYPFMQNENYDPLYYDVPTAPFPDTGPAIIHGSLAQTLENIAAVVEGHGVVIGELSQALADVTLTGIAGRLPEYGGDPHWDKVSLLMHCETMKDEVSGLDATVVGANVNSTDTFKFGEKSLRVVPDANALSYVSFPGGNQFSFGTGAFTIEFWWRPVVITQAALIAQYSYYLQNNPHWIVQAAGNRITFVYYDGASHSTGQTPSGSIVANDWHHICVERDDGSNLRIYLNGVMSVKEQSFNHNMGASPSPIIIGSLEPDITDNYKANGYFDEIRITKGLARYGSDGGFPVQTLQFDSIPHQDNQGVLNLPLDGFGIDFTGTLPEVHLCTLASTLDDVGVSAKSVKQLASWTRAKGCALLIGA